MNAKTIILYLILLASLNLNGQTLEEAKKALKEVSQIEQIEILIRNHSNWDISIDITMISDSILFPKIINANIGDIVLMQFNYDTPKFVLKVLKIDSVELCKVKYIYLSGLTYSKTEIDSLRTIIINRFNNGESFETLAKEYSMDNNPTGDLDWFYKGMMVDEFDNAVRFRQKGEIFTVDVKDENWYYVVLKTHENKIEIAVKSIMIKYLI